MPPSHRIYVNNQLVPNIFMRIAGLGISQASFMVGIFILAGAAPANEVEIEKLKQGLKNPNEAARVNAIRMLKTSETEAAKAAEVLVPLLADKSAQVQQAAAAALMKVGSRAIPALSVGVKNSPVEAQILAVGIISSYGIAAKETIPLLTERARSDHFPLRTASNEALARLVPESLPAVTILLADKDPTVRLAAVSALQKVLDDKDWAARRSAGLALTKVGIQAVPGLIEVVEKNPVPCARAEAIFALGTIGQGAKAAIKPLIEVIRDPNHGHLQKLALAALANMNPEAGAALASLLNDRDGSVRVLAINTLTADQAGSAKVGLLKMLRDPSEEVRQAAARALARIGPDILPDVEPLLTDTKAETRAAAIQAIGPFTTVATVGKFLRDEGIVAQQAGVVFLAKRGAEAIPVLIDALRSKNFRAELAAAKTIALLPDRADDLIPVLVDVLLAKETQEPEAVAKTILRVNSSYGARELAHKAQAPELLRLLKKAGFLEKEIPAVQEVVCLALAERGADAGKVVPSLIELLKNPMTEVGVLAAAARAVNAMGPRDSAYRTAPDLIDRIVQGTREKSKLLRDDGMSDLVRVGMKGETFEAILTMLTLDENTDEANEWIIHHANATSAWNLAGPNLVRVLALFHSQSKLGPRRLTSAAEDALKAHLWRYLQHPLSGKGPGILQRPAKDVSAVLPIDHLAWTTSAYLALDILKDDPEYKERKIEGRTPREYYQDWTIWWREWAKYRALHGLWSEMGFTSHQTFIWPNLLNMVDLAGDPIVKERFRMLLDLTMIEEEQISMQGARAGRRGKNNEAGSNLDPWKDLLFGEEPRRFAEANINYRGIYWTTAYKLPPAAILLRKLNRPESHYAITNHHFFGGTVHAFAAPHYILASQVSQPKGSMEFPGSWHRLIFDDHNAILFPLTDGGRHHLQHRNIYITRFAGIDHPAIDFTAALKIVEKGGWIFASNGPAFAGIYFDGGYLLERSGRKEQGRQNCDSIYPKAPQTIIVLHAGDLQTFGSFEKFQDAILKAPLKITDESLRYTGPDMPAIEFFRDPAKASLIAGAPQPFRSETKTYDSPHLLAEVGKSRVLVRVGQYSAVYDFEIDAVVEEKGLGNEQGKK